MIVVDESSIDSLLPHQQLHDALREGFVASTTPSIVTPPRLCLSAPLGPSLVKPSMITTPSSTTMGVKIVSVRDDNSPHNASNVPSTILMINPTTGALSHVLPGDLITARRTAGASGVATAALHSPASAPLALLVFGAGIQGEEHVKTMMTVRPSIGKITIINRTLPRLTSLIAKLSPLYPDVVFTACTNDQEHLVSAAVKEADIVNCCVSRKAGDDSGAKPLFDGNLLKRNAMVTSVGSFTPDTREIDRNVLRRAKGRIFIDDDGAKSVGDFALESWTEYELLGEFLATATPPTVEGDITFFKSVGVGWLDIIAGGLVVNNL